MDQQIASKILLFLPFNTSSPVKVKSIQLKKEPIAKNNFNFPNFIQAKGEEKICL